MSTSAAVFRSVVACMCVFLFVYHDPTFYALYHKFHVSLNLSTSCDHLYSRAKWVEISGTLYKRKCILPIKADEDDFPVFGKVSGIYVTEGDVVFDVNIRRTCAYEPHYHAYTLKNTSNTVLVRYQDLLCFYPLYEKVVPERPDVAVVVLKHRLLIQ